MCTYIVGARRCSLGMAIPFTNPVHGKALGINTTFSFDKCRRSLARTTPAMFYYSPYGVSFYVIQLVVVVATLKKKKNLV